MLLNGIGRTTVESLCQDQLSIENVSKFVLLNGVGRPTVESLCQDQLSIENISTHVSQLDGNQTHLTNQFAGLVRSMIRVSQMCGLVPD